MSTDDPSEPEAQTEDDEHSPLNCDSPILSQETDPDQPPASNYDDSNAGASSLARASAIRQGNVLRNGRLKYWKMTYHGQPRGGCRNCNCI